MILLLLACTASPPEKESPTADDSAILVDRGPTTIPVDGDPNGLWWADGKLTIADDDNNRILQWTDSAGIGLVGDLPAAAAEGAGLGQVIVLDDGTHVVPRFGYGTTGDVVTLSAAGVGAVVPGLDVEHRRIGLALGKDEAIYVGWFVSGDAGRVGAVSRLDLAGTETEVLGNLGKPVGIFVWEEQIYVADQDAGELLVAPLADPAAVQVLAQVEAPDLLCGGPDGSLFTGGAGEVRQISAEGTVTTLSSGYQSVRGVAYDADHQRLFLVDHDIDDADGTTHFLHIIPVP
ncbi:MAG TPA: hypothetical protein PKY30_21220 [Myxococcota bacterium]|nr:hypothetical protein [Myxococcota bacterium]HNH49578.1 hypothetical protein [Myxococcota bacterium]